MITAIIIVEKIPQKKLIDVEIMSRFPQTINQVENAKRATINT
jgi:hypothetical protein